MTKLEAERLAIVETKVDDLCNKMENIEAKLDLAIANKADKSEVKALNDKIWGIIIGVAAFGVTT